MTHISEKTIERLILYRRLLINFKANGNSNIFSHQLAKLSGFTPAQIRRDLSPIIYYGSPVHGYEINRLIDGIGELIDPSEKQGIALVGLGNLGRAILDYFQGRQPKLEITAAFDTDPQKIGRVISGCQCYHTNELEKIIKEKEIIVAIIAVPANEAQDIATRLVKAGVKGLQNYSPVKLQIPANVHVENRDMIMAVEKVAYFARQAT